VPELVKDNKSLGSTIAPFSIPEAVAEIHNQIRIDSVNSQNERVTIALRNFHSRATCPVWLRSFGSEKQTVGVVVPNYNYMKYLNLRMASY